MHLNLILLSTLLSLLLNAVLGSRTLFRAIPKRSLFKSDIHSNAFSIKPSSIIRSFSSLSISPSFSSKGQDQFKASSFLPVLGLGIFPIAKVLSDDENENESKNMIDKLISKRELDFEKLKPYIDKLGPRIFLQNLVLIINDRRDRIPIDDIFWMDLSEFLLEIIFHLKSKMINASDSDLRMVSYEIRFIDSMNKMFRLLHPNFHLRTMDVDDFRDSFIKLGFFKHSDRISKEFVKALQYTYLSSFKFDCKTLKMEFFKDGNTDNDVLLKLFMIKYDKGEMIKYCINSDSRLQYLNITKESIKEIRNDIHGLETKGIEHFIDISYAVPSASKSTMNFILSKGKKVFVKNGDNLYWLLKRMDQTGLLNKENIRAIAEFENDDIPTRPNKWNQEKFERYLNEYGKECKIDKIEFINKCLALFSLEPLKERSV